MIGQLWRLVAILDVLVIFGGLVYLHLGLGRELPRVLYRVGFDFAAILALVAVGVFANLLSPYPPTPGAKLFAAGGALVAVDVLWTCVKVARTGAGSDLRP